jgi:hypothetical protein
MATSKVTFTLDENTVRQLQEASELLSKPKSQVVREAVTEYRQRIGKLSDSERIRMLHVFDTLVPKIPPRPRSEVDAELREIRRARRHGGRRTRVE